MTTTTDSCEAGNVTPGLERIVVEMGDRVPGRTRSSSRQDCWPVWHAGDIHNPCPVAGTGR